MVNGHNSGAKKSENKPSFSDQDDQKVSEVQSLILAQLAVASPASLPLNLIIQGMACLNNGYNEILVVRVLNTLVAEGSIIKISECDFSDRYRLVDQPSSKDLEREEQ